MRRYENEEDIDDIFILLPNEYNTKQHTKSGPNVEIRLILPTNKLINNLRPTLK